MKDVETERLSKREKQGGARERERKEGEIERPEREKKGR